MNDAYTSIHSCKKSHHTRYIGRLPGDAMANADQPHANRAAQGLVPARWLRVSGKEEGSVAGFNFSTKEGEIEGRFAAAENLLATPHCTDGGDRFAALSGRRLPRAELRQWRRHVRQV
ncbi:hypothetical protein NKI12_16290 [Mesorhizobium australicum]|uniref:Uncharacterized protein n=1 Tax=Mesorhizobium australicum TaxID=536018 RepID=A0ACC6SY35_9HYPH